MNNIKLLKYSKSKKAGFSIIEAIVASSIFALIVTGLVGLLLYANRYTQFSGSKNRAVLVTNEGLEAVRSIRDRDFENLVDGIYGLERSNDKWNFSGSNDITGEYIRQIEILTVDSYTKEIKSRVDWENNGIDDSVELITYLTNWGIVAAPQADSLSVDDSDAYIPSQKKDRDKLKGIDIENTGDADIVIDVITVEWDNNKKMDEIVIDGTIVWSNSGPGSPTGVQSSIAVIDISDYTLVANSGLIDIDEFAFNGNMENNIFTITFTMLDGSEVLVEDIDPIQP
ncbi:prepilin-type N-terminal cleavage/methylation domain-containing protein [Patescibacteria group bacterium]